MPARAPDTNHEKEKGRVILAPRTDYDREWFKAAMTKDTKFQKEIFKSITLNNMEKRRKASTHTKQAEKETPASDTDSYYMEDSDTDSQHEEAVQEKKQKEKGKGTRE